MFLSWFVGEERAQQITAKNDRAQISDINVTYEELNTAVMEKDVQNHLQHYKIIFDDDGWKKAEEMS